jgi:hypothetical protein
MIVITIAFSLATVAELRTFQRWIGVVSLRFALSLLNMR